jgi:bifunctional ADP-heptose synthase (sugar kinase/adenylyltransferase)
MIVERCRSYLMKNNINIDNLKRIIGSFKNSNVLVIGDLFFKDYLFSNNPEISRDSPNLDLEILGEKRIIGGAGLIAKFLSDLDANVSLISVNPSGEEDELIKDLKKEINIESILFDYGKLPVPVKKRILLKDRTILDMKVGSNFIFDTSTEKNFLDSIIEKMNSSNAVIMCDYGFGFMTDKIIDSVLSLSKEKNIPVTLITGTNSGRNLHKYYGLKLVVLNEGEARNLANDFCSGFDSLAKNILSKTGCENIIFDLDNEGFICYRQLLESDETAGNYASYLPIFSFNNKNITEWKDALRVIIAISRFSGGNIYESLYIGNLVSLIEFSVLNKGSLSISDILAVLETRKELF